MNLLATNRFGKIANRTRRDAGMTMLQKPTDSPAVDSGESFLMEWLAVR
jgi:hypothetical protein